ncbi:hypothetical protein HW555_010283 [Spodoptera exigua]|uniref:Chitin-binding type-2 domain-containing protein n=1 Tax=Spodoptera exigua TaxID=7107 RepID=A0A835L123_SPOEX|nr:hypothetical protein HW555_010283 [Spodoptera exigua]KAH9636681.1 hypothetical protein HF086_003229 [Spodoptera exigua]
MKGLLFLMLCVALVYVSAASVCPMGHMLIPHEYCDRFYMCIGGRKIELLCAPGTVYDPELQICANAHNTDCGNRILP